MTNLVPLALQIPWRQSVKIFPSSGLVTVAAGGSTNGNIAPSKIFALIASNNDTLAHDVIVGITDVANTFTALGTVTIPISAGYVGTTPSVNMLTGLLSLPLDETGMPFLFLNPTDLLQVKSLVALNTGRDIDIVCFGADF